MSNEYQEASKPPSQNPLEFGGPAGVQVPESPKPRVLVVEDNEAVAEGLRMLLGRLYEVVVAVGGAEGLQVLASCDPFEAVLCDVMMPGVSGIELFRTLQDSSPDQARRVIFMTGGAYTEEADEFLQGIGNVQVRKPFNFGVLHQQLQRVISLRH